MERSNYNLMHTMKYCFPSLRELEKYRDLLITNSPYNLNIDVMNIIIDYMYKVLYHSKCLMINEYKTRIPYTRRHETKFKYDIIEEIRWKPFSLIYNELEGRDTIVDKYGNKKRYYTFIFCEVKKDNYINVDSDDDDY